MYKRQDINNNLKNLNAEMRRVTAEYKGNENSIEALKAKQCVLSEKYAEYANYLKDNVSSLEDILSWEKINCNSINVTEASAPFSDEPLEYNFGYDDLAFFVYTSGTTGHPKGAMLSHGNMLNDAESIDGALKWQSSKKFLLFLPIFHSYTLMTSVLYLSLIHI